MNTRGHFCKERENIAFQLFALCGLGKRRFVRLVYVKTQKGYEPSTRGFITGSLCFKGSVYSD